MYEQVEKLKTKNNEIRNDRMQSGSNMSCGTTVIIQRQTTVTLGKDKNDVPWNEKITGLHHNRSAVSSAARKAAKKRDWVKVPKNSVCNHSISYDRIMNALTGLSENVEVHEFMNNLQALATAISKDIKIPQEHIKVLQNLIVNRESVKRNELNSCINYLIYKICDAPENLFFWPDRTQSEPDRPKGNVAHQGWQPQPGLDLTGQATITALNKYEETLKQYLAQF